MPQVMDDLTSPRPIAPNSLQFRSPLMRYPFQWTVLAVISCAGMGLAQEGKKDAPRPILAEGRLGDGSLVRISILQENLDVMTRYGKLTVPFSEIRRIDFGLHLAEGVGNKIDTAIKHLGSDAFPARGT